MAKVPTDGEVLAGTAVLTIAAGFVVWLWRLVARARARLRDFLGTLVRAPALRLLDDRVSQVEKDATGGIRDMRTEVERRLALHEQKAAEAIHELREEVRTFAREGATRTDRVEGKVDRILEHWAIPPKAPPQ